MTKTKVLDTGLMSAAHREFPPFAPQPQLKQRRHLDRLLWLTEFGSHDDRHRSHLMLYSNSSSSSRHSCSSSSASTATSLSCKPSQHQILIRWWIFLSPKRTLKSDEASSHTTTSEEDLTHCMGHELLCVNLGSKHRAMNSNVRQCLRLAWPNSTINYCTPTSYPPE